MSEFLVIFIVSDHENLHVLEYIQKDILHNSNSDIIRSDTKMKMDHEYY